MTQCNGCTVKSGHGLMSVESALANAIAGRLVFPVKIAVRSGDKADKIPLVKWGTAATSNVAVVRRLWMDFPGAFTGVVTGRTSDLYIVDVDDPKALVASSLDVTFGQKVATRRKGGSHYWFSSPLDGLTVPNSADGGLDVRGDGGYIVCWGAPPTATLSPLPLSIAEWARARRTDLIPVEGTEFSVPEGGRESYLVGLAGVMRRRGAGVNAITSALIIENSEKCSPPVGMDDIDRIAGSVSRYAVEGTAPAYDGVLAALRARAGKKAC
jgi:hypothetical protein